MQAERGENFPVKNHLNNKTEDNSFRLKIQESPSQMPTKHYGLTWIYHRDFEIKVYFPLFTVSKIPVLSEVQ